MSIVTFSPDSKTRRETGGYGLLPEASQIALFLMPKFKPDRLIELVDYDITDVNNETVPAGYITLGKWVNGRREQSRKYTSEETWVGGTITIQLPPYNSTILDQVARWGVDCYYLIAMKKCASGNSGCIECNDVYTIFDVRVSFPSDISPLTGVRTGGEDTRRRTATLTINGRAQIPNMTRETMESDSDNPLYFVRIVQHENSCNCGVPNCGHRLTVLIGGGGDDPYLAKYTNDFQDVEVIDTGLSAGNVITDALLLDDGTLMVAYADDFNPATSLTGGIVIDVGGTGTFVDGVKAENGNVLDKPVYGFVETGSRVYSYGDAARPLMYWNYNTDEYVNLSNLVPNGGAIRDAVPYQDRVILVGGGAGLFILITVDSQNNVQDLSSYLPTPGASDWLNTVNIWGGDDIIFIGTREGVLFYSNDKMQTWVTWRTEPGTPVINSMRGDFGNMLWSADNALYQINPFTRQDNLPLTLLSAFTGDITGIAVEQQSFSVNGNLSEMTGIVIVTSGGDAIYIKTCVPNILDVIA